MKIAILGAGFAGLATAWYALQHGHEVTIFDPNGIGNGASGAAAGLLHPYAGTHAKLNRRGREGFAATKELLDVSSQALGQNLLNESGLFRVALSEQQKEDFALAAERYDDIEWCKMDIPGMVSEPGIFIKSAVAIDAKRYLKGLWIACAKQGAEIQFQSISQPEEFQHIIAAMGAATASLPELSDLPINFTKGQVLEVRWPETLPPLDIAVSSQAYLLMNAGNRSCTVGATFERGFSSPEPDPEKAIPELRAKVEAFFPGLRDAEVLSCRSGVRVSAPDHMPMISTLHDRYSVITGLGSKGLLYHALYAKELINKFDI